MGSMMLQNVYTVKYIVCSVQCSTGMSASVLWVHGAAECTHCVAYSCCVQSVVYRVLCTVCCVQCSTGMSARVLWGP